MYNYILYINIIVDSPAVNYDDNKKGKCNNHGEAVINGNEYWDKNVITYCKCFAGYDGPTCADSIL